MTDSTNNSPGTTVPDNTPGNVQPDKVPGTTPSRDTYVVADKLGMEDISNQVLEAKFGDDFINLTTAAKNTVRSSFAQYMYEDRKFYDILPKEEYSGIRHGLMKGADAIVDKDAVFNKYTDWLSHTKKFKTAAKIIKPLLAKQ